MFASLDDIHDAGIDNIGYQLMPGNDVAMRHTGFQDIKPDFYHYMLAKLGASAAANLIKDHPELPVIYINRYPAGISEMPSDEAAIVTAAVKGRESVRLEDQAAVLRDRDFCDALKVETPDSNLRQYHYRKDGKDYYLLGNASVSETVDVFFRKPEGKEFTCYEAYEQKAVDCAGDNGRLRIVLPPYHSVIQTDAEVAVKEKEAAGIIKDTAVLKDFTLELRPVGKEAQLFEGFALQPISNIDRDFSGEMVYRTALDCKPGVKKAYFSAEHVYECMQLVVNGTELPKIIVPPYTADITCALREGKNTIEIRVASTALRDANTKPGFFGKERTIIEPTGMFGGVRIDFCE